MATKVNKAEEQKRWPGRIDIHGARVIPQPGGQEIFDERALGDLTKAELIHYYRCLYDHAHTLDIQKHDFEGQLGPCKEELKKAQRSEANAIERYRQRELELRDAAMTIEVLYAALATTDPFGYLMELKAWEAALNTRWLEDQMGLVRTS